MKTWVIPGGRIPLAFSSADILCLLNRGEKTCVSLFIYHPDKDPVGPYQISIGAKRVCKVMLHQFIDPEALLLDEPYSIVITAPQELIIQFTRRDTSSSQVSICGGLSYSQA